MEGQKRPNGFRARSGFGVRRVGAVLTFADLVMPRQLNRLPVNFPVPNFQPGNARRRTSVGPRYATGIEKEDAPAHLIAWNVRVAVQNNIDIIG